MDNVVRWCAWMVVVLAIATPLNAVAEETITLISYSDTWRYNQDGREPPPEWKQPGFNDASWLQGAGVFVVPADEPLGGVASPGTFLSLYAPTGTAQVITYYFRRRFDFPHVPDARFVVTASNLIDDGAVFYLNGTEVARVGMPSGTITYGHIASRAVDVSNIGADRFVIPRAALVQGINTLAVELHQSGSISADAVLGMSLTARILDPIEIIDEPEDAIAEEGQTVHLSVEVTGSDPVYTWYRGSTRLATNWTSQLTLTNVRTNEADQYYALVSNSLNVVTSRLASVTVLRDTNPPVLLLAEEQASTSPAPLVLLHFTEPVLRFNGAKPSASGTNTLNFRVMEFGTTNTMAVQNSQVAVGANQVRLTLETGLKRNAYYTVTVTNLTDWRSNVMVNPNFAFIGLYTSNALVAFDSIWAWDESGQDLGTMWREPDYDDRHWARGRGVFAYEFNTIDLCGATKNTALSVGPTTYYFRFPFVVQRTSGRAVFSWVAETIDDGAIFYLNGAELRRVNMPAGPVTAPTSAFAPREGTCARPVANVTATNLVEGTNVLAVEVHQAGTDIDVVFGLQLDAFIQLPYPVPVPLTVSRTVTGEVVVSWVGREGLLKAANDPTGPWFPLSTNAPVVITPTLGASFFRLDPLTP